ncbi:YrhB domain-containing protein [Bernardetia sp. OM2101]|uniref:YrhB domain-containing protein n=1 Tax=Bernardetia sp. OM2101 TaxID=3344876 RepID=UPI0035CEC4D9
MIDIEEANRIIEERMKQETKSHKSKVIAKLREEKEFGWIYGYNTEEFFLNRKSMNFLLGNGALVVNRYDGSLIEVLLSVEDIIIGINTVDRYMDLKYGIAIPNEKERKEERRKEAKEFYEKLELEQRRINTNIFYRIFYFFKNYFRGY